MAREKGARQKNILPSPDLLHPRESRPVERDVRFYYDLHIDSIVEGIVPSLIGKSDKDRYNSDFDRVKTGIKGTLDSLFIKVRA